MPILSVDEQGLLTITTSLDDGDPVDLPNAVAALDAIRTDLVLAGSGHAAGHRRASFLARLPVTSPGSIAEALAGPRCHLVSLVLGEAVIEMCRAAMVTVSVGDVRRVSGRAVRRFRSLATESAQL